MDRIVKVDPWCIFEDELHKDQMRFSESLMSIGNGHMGIRGNFEEKYSGDHLEGNYLAGVWFPDRARSDWWESGYPQYFGKVINSMNTISMRIRIDKEDIDLHVDEVQMFNRKLDMYTGVLTREYTITRNRGDVHVWVERFVSAARPELLAIRCRINAEYPCRVTLLPAVIADVYDEDMQDEGSYWDLLGADEENDIAFITARTRENPFNVPEFTVSTAMGVLPCGEVRKDRSYTDDTEIVRKLSFEVVPGEIVGCDKFVCVSTSRDHSEGEILNSAKTGVISALEEGYDKLIREHEREWARRWEKADITIDGDDESQQAVRYNLFQMFSTYYGEDNRLNIGPRGFADRKYGGATCWDSEVYCLPVYMATAGQSVAQNLLRYRFLQLEGAYHNAREQGMPGALYPMATLTGVECHNKWEITLEEIHRNNVIAYAIFNYTQYTGDRSYLETCGIDVLTGISRFWMERVHYSARKKQYMIHGVTGPNEYESNVNNNWYTNRMTAWTLSYTAEQLKLVSDEKRNELGVTADEIEKMVEISENLYLPYDSELDLFVQHDTFLDKELVTVDDLNPADRPIRQKWSWDRIMRSCFIKQADTLQGLYFLEHLYDTDTLRRHFDFYEPMTVHESSLSPCIHSIIAARIGYLDKAEEFFLRTARLDLDNISGDTQEGLHITAMSGTWLSIVKGFAGMRTADGMLSFSPQLPGHWNSYAFRLVYRNRLLSVSVDSDGAKVERLSGEPLEIVLFDKKVKI